jgi:hypothetical protein
MYVEGNPEGYSDPTGHIKWKWIKNCISSISGYKEGGKKGVECRLGSIIVQNAVSGVSGGLIDVSFSYTYEEGFGYSSGVKIYCFDVGLAHDQKGDFKGYSIYFGVNVPICPGLAVGEQNKYNPSTKSWKVTGGVSFSISGEKNLSNNYIYAKFGFEIDGNRNSIENYSWGPSVGTGYDGKIVKTSVGVKYDIASGKFSPEYSAKVRVLSVTPLDSSGNPISSSQARSTIKEDGVGNYINSISGFRISFFGKSFDTDSDKENE